MLTQVKTKQKNAIMRRIYILWIMKKVFSFAGIKLMAMVVLFGQALSSVSVGKVLANAPALSDLSGSVYFYTNAFMNTQMSVQALIALAVFSVTVYGMDIAFRTGRVVAAQVRRYVFIPVRGARSLEQ